MNGTIKTKTEKGYGFISREGEEKGFRIETFKENDGIRKRMRLPANTS